MSAQGFFSRSFWSHGYCVSTVVLDEAMIRRYIQDQENTRVTEQSELDFDYA